jgi:hypothetical protein
MASSSSNSNRQLFISQTSLLSYKQINNNIKMASQPYITCFMEQYKEIKYRKKEQVTAKKRLTFLTRLSRTLEPNMYRS